MTRFRAYVSDSDEEENVSYDEVDLELEEASESESSQHPGRAEDEPPEDEEDEGEDDRDADAEGEDDDENDENTPPPLLHRQDPSITPWAREVGVESQKMHVMQASFFRASEEAAALHVAANASPLRPRPGSRKVLNIPGSTSTQAKHAREPEGEARHAPPRQVRLLRPWRQWKDLRSAIARNFCPELTAQILSPFFKVRACGQCKQRRGGTRGHAGRLWPSAGTLVPGQLGPWWKTSLHGEPLCSRQQVIVRVSVNRSNASLNISQKLRGQLISRQH